MQNLQHILQILHELRESFQGPYFIPAVWNFLEYRSFSGDRTAKEEINVNPYDFVSRCLSGQILTHARPDRDYLAGWNGGPVAGPWELAGSVIYSMFPRMFTAWDHFHNGEIIPGSFLKAICLLPFLKRMKVDIVYLLPVFCHSDRYQKGEAGSPYSIKNIYRLDPGLHDPLLGTGDPELVETEFKAFVEACHILGIRVMLDFVFRTVARDCDLLSEHPDWFYWVDLQGIDTFGPPLVVNEPELSIVNRRSLRNLYQTRGIGEYLDRFSFSPERLDPQKWELVQKEARQTGANILDALETAFGITTAPGFSDVINDPQPPWTDVTYLRFYFDLHPQAGRYVSREQPPYVLQDVASLNTCRGRTVNRELWDYTAGVIPHYQKNYGIDGARIDMGHALPPALNREIVARIKTENPGFLLWSEEYNVKNAGRAGAEGFHFICGELWTLYRDLEKTGFVRRLLKTVSASELPMIAALETPDTRRIATVGEEARLVLLLFLNFLLPKAIPFINNGMELLERQPMNLGFVADSGGRFVLEQDDPLYGKLAFFDHYRLHWLNERQEWFRDLLDRALTIRRAYYDLIGNDACLLREKTGNSGKKLLFLGFARPETDRNLFLVANRDLSRKARVDLRKFLPERLFADGAALTRLFGYGAALSVRRGWEGDGRGWLEPGELCVGCMKKPNSGENEDVESK
jgi:starch synthase (maltosyl-transferring)